MAPKIVGNDVTAEGNVLKELTVSGNRLVLIEDFKSQSKVALCFDSMTEKEDIPGVVENQEVEAVGRLNGETSLATDGGDTKVLKIEVRSLIIRSLGSSEPLFFK